MYYLWYYITSKYIKNINMELIGFAFPTVSLLPRTSALLVPLVRHMSSVGLKWNYSPGTLSSLSSHCNLFQDRVSIRVHNLQMGYGDLTKFVGHLFVSPVLIYSAFPFVNGTLKSDVLLFYIQICIKIGICHVNRLYFISPLLSHSWMRHVKKHWKQKIMFKHLHNICVQL